MPCTFYVLNILLCNKLNSWKKNLLCADSLLSWCPDIFFDICSKNFVGVMNSWVNEHQNSQKK